MVVTNLETRLNRSSSLKVPRKLPIKAMYAWQKSRTQNVHALHATNIATTSIGGVPQCVVVRYSHSNLLAQNLAGLKLVLLDCWHERSGPVDNVDNNNNRPSYRDSLLPPIRSNLSFIRSSMASVMPFMS